MDKRINLTTIAKALANNEFFFYYQPVISLETGMICGAESLIRWKKPNGSMIYPNQFIPIAEENGFITEITQYMLPKVIDGLKTLSCIDDLFWVSFNVSAKDFNDTNFVMTLHNSTHENNFRTENLWIEITETSFLPSNPKTQKIINDISTQGFSIVLNDFTSGFTDFSTLTQIPIKAIKIAMGVIQRAPKSRIDFRLVRHLINMAHQLRLPIIAEGVEDEETHSLMAALGCTHTQGYFYGRPMPLESLVEIISTQPNWLKYPFGLEYLAQYDHIDFRRDIIRAALMMAKHRNEDITERALTRLPELDFQKCQFGEWYTKSEKLYNGNECFKKLGIEHENFHNSAIKLIALAKEGTSLENMEGIINDLSTTSKVILNLLQDLEIEKLKDFFK